MDVVYAPNIIITHVVKKNILVLRKKFIIKSATQLKFPNFRLLRRSRS